VSRARARRFGGLAVVAAATVALVVIPLASSEPTRSQSFFRDHLLSDAKTAVSIKSALRDGSAIVDRSIAFRDLTGDDKDDAVVRVLSTGSAGAVAVYVFSTDGAKALRAVHRSQKLTRASTAVKDGVLSYRTATYAAGDELCCPSKIVETELEWNETGHRFTVADRRDIGTATPTPTPTATPQG
jgi:hypothetical protein